MSELTHAVRIFALRLRAAVSRPTLVAQGFCPICRREATFFGFGEWLRDCYRCLGCGSVPRERALMRVIDSAFQNWRALRIHESSPIPRGASRALRKECRSYTQSQYFPHQPAGALVGAFRNENLENLSLADESVDILVSQDVLEHVLDPEAAFREIGRVLAPGGAHVFTVPLVRGDSPSVIRARRSSIGIVVHHLPPEYHKNPLSRSGSLVATDWGFDIVDTIVASSGLATDIVKADDPTLGIVGKFSEVVVSRKGPSRPTCATGHSRPGDTPGAGR